jgi:hypothetical protein
LTLAFLEVGGFLVIRRIATVCTLVLALAAAPAFADGHYRLHTQMKGGSATSSRHRGGCVVAARSHAELGVTCHGRSKATLVYTFSTGHDRVYGKAMSWIHAYGHVHVSRSTRTSDHTIRVTVTISGGNVTVDSVCVTYYA